MYNVWLDQNSEKYSVTKYLLLSWIIAGIVAGNWWAFAVDPTLYETLGLKQLMYMYWAGWLLMILAPQVFVLALVWKRMPSALILFLVGTVRPVSILLIHYQLHSATGIWYFSYLTDNPIFFISDVLIPGLYIWLARRQNQNSIIATTANDYSRASIEEMN